MPAKPRTDDEPSRIDSAVRIAIAGHPRGTIRRIILWVVAYTALIAAVFMLPPLSPPVLVALLVASVSLLLLMLTDGLV